jgi:hypothetical protein
MRAFHRWTSIVFTLAVIVNGAMVLRGRYSARMGLVAVAILFALLLSGLYLFALPYMVRWSRRVRLMSKAHDGLRSS